MNEGQKAPAKSTHAEREERVLGFWAKDETFKKSLKKKSLKGEFTFYDGPPFATGTPHYGHILAGTIKDVIPRYKTMRGYHVSRKWGWDCHGLPVENLIEKELNLETKKDIISYGIDKFNAASKKSVMRYADEWRKIVPRMGRWVDMDDDYRTMDASYTETVWWIFKNLFDKGLIYEGFKSMNMCPRCETTLSNFEVAQGYKDITDISVYVKFKVNNEKLTMKVQGDVFLLAWTTTPWTLPGNVALAVNPNIDYVKVKIDAENYILAESRLSSLKDKKYEIVSKIKGSELVGLEYEPLFDYYSTDKSIKNRENGWKVYGADFVTTEDGTGIVHIAPAFGADDYELLKKHNLPFVQHVSVDGHFKKEVTDFAGMAVKPKATPEDKFAYQKADIEIIKWLAHHGNLFEKEKLIHSYPHCWRCETPLLNYASSSWFVKVTDIKDKLVKENKKVTWIPPEVGEGRFGNWLEGARDWAISRSRFWGAPIPVWKTQGEGGREKGESKAQSERYIVIGSVDDLKKYSKAKNSYFVMRHGEAENNVKGILSAKADTPHHLTEKGRQQVKDTANKLKGEKFDLVYVSPFVRTKETADILAKELVWDKKIINTDDRLHELNSGNWDGKKVEEFSKAFPYNERFVKFPEGGESYADIKKRVGDFLYEMESKHEGKRILIITHESPAMMLFSVALGLDRKGSFNKQSTGDFMANAEFRKVDFTPLPHNEEYELDLHRPYIDTINLEMSDGTKLVRVPDVFDCWFESGSMPYASQHYPFESQGERRTENGESKAVFEPKSSWFRKSKGYPADFIAEGLDQTRGWFYSMIVLGVALFGRSPYKKVIVNGLVLAEDGEKMSKSKKNYPDPMNLVEKYGADSVRFYMLSSPVVHAQDLCFSEKGVDEVTKKVVNRILNVVTFYKTYSHSEKNGAGGKEQGVSKSQAASAHILDKWMVARLNQAIQQVTLALEAGELDRGTRPILDLVDDLSTWYLRRSRDRFKGDDEADKQSAIQTTELVLIEIAKLIAPYMPFLAEEIYQNIQYPISCLPAGMANFQNGEGIGNKSVHLEEWPKGGPIDTALIDSMVIVRDIASKGLEARTNAKINVRQPLKELRIKNMELGIKNVDKNNPLIELIKDEVNVKEVAFDASLEKDVELDTNITPELREEGMVRELLRAIQDLRKEKGLTVRDHTKLKVDTDEAGKKFIRDHGDEIKDACLVDEIDFAQVDVVPVNIGEVNVKISLEDK